MTANGGTRFLLPEGGGRSYRIAVTGPLNGPAASSLRIRPTVDRPTAMTQAYRGGAERSTWGTREPVAESPLAGRG
jgi:hypothetical protein